MTLRMMNMVWLLARWLGPDAVGVIAGWAIWSRLAARADLRRRQSRVEQEMQTYAGLEVRLGPDEDVRALAARVCRAMSEMSAFRRVAMLVRDSQERLVVAASAGMEEAAVESLELWAESMMTEERGLGTAIRRGDGGLGVRVGNGSYAAVLGKKPGESGYARAVMIPLWTTGGRALGMLAVGADGLMGARRSALARALAPIELLGIKVSRAMENAALAERLMRAEKLAGLGLLASGMAHALNNPLTAVLGFAELIGGTTDELRVKEDAAIIVREAQTMRRTLESLLEFSRPVELDGAVVDVWQMVRDLEAACGDVLRDRGVRLVVQGDEMELLVRGNRHRLRQMMEHLLNNAAQAVGRVGGGSEAEVPVIRISVSGGEAVHVVVSDTGPGFREPGRMFDPSGINETAGVGLGLGICYGIVHEHGGDIRAFNLHPHGGGVAVELPRVVVAEKKLESIPVLAAVAK
ncbi:MAG: HAMP domain-containing histidine kinase [Acidobacteriota bacterium]|nr:HAMP domain-containing histidine kinase [Acidobacteriota bacterium]